MSKKVIERLKAKFGDAVLATSDFRGDDEAIVTHASWHDVAVYLRDDADLRMDHFVDLTACDYPLRDGVGRFDVVLLMRSMKFNHRVRIKTRVNDGDALATLSDVWPAANWSEREIFEMFGISFQNHPDLRQLLLYPEFVGNPLRKDYPIEGAQPLVEYREGFDKIAPFGDAEGQPWARIDWAARMEGREYPVSPALAAEVPAKTN